MSAKINTEASLFGSSGLFDITLRLAKEDKKGRP